MSGELPPGTWIAGDFRIERPLGAGGMGVVYVAEQRSTGRLRALKVMRRDLLAAGSERERFALEATVGGSIRSAHVVEVVAAGVCDTTGLPYIAMEYLEGEDLAACVARGGPLGPALARKVLGELGHGLAAAHAVGIVHRDIKPENVFLVRVPDAERSIVTKILDFGIAKVVQAARTSKTASIGTPLWMAPEQSDPDGVIGPATDVWAFALVAFHALTGKVYWRAAHAPDTSVLMLLREALGEPIEPPSSRARALGATAPPLGFDGWFERAMAKRPEGRFAHAGLAVAELRPILERGTSAPSPASWAPAVAASPPFAPTPAVAASRPFAPTPPTPAPRRSRWALVAALTTVPLIAVAGWLVALRGRATAGDDKAPASAPAPPRDDAALVVAAAPTSCAPASSASHAAVPKVVATSGPPKDAGGLPPFDAIAAREALTRAEELVRKHCGPLLPASTSVMASASVRFDPDGRVTATPALGGPAQAIRACVQSTLGTTSGQIFRGAPVSLESNFAVSGR